MSVLRFRDFRLLWLSQSASMIGDALIIVAIGLYVTRLTGDAGDVGLVLAAYSIPLVLFLLFGGVLADRLPRQRVMVVTDVIRALLHGALAVLIATGTVRVWMMVIVGVFFGMAQAFFQPAYTGLVPQTVPEADIQSAQALGGVSRELAAFASPALATALVLGVGGAFAFGLDALTFAVSAAMLMRVRSRSRGVHIEGGSVLFELRQGWTAVRERTWVLGTILAFSAALLLSLAPFLVLGATVAKQVYGTEAVFGFANAAWGVGTISGALIGLRWRPRRPMLTGMIVCSPWPAAIALYGAGPPQLLLYPALAVAGLGIGLFGVWWETALAQRIPPQLLSRVSAWDWMGSLALLPLGYLLAGPVAQVVGEVTVLVGGGLLGSLACALGLLPKSTRTLARLADAPAVPIEAAGLAVSPVL
ncbi:MAG: major facilitator superfamily 1 [Frankiales bacterium]|nr:major facilitator superfamily 1 [Frankiales bacterium]